MCELHAMLVDGTERKLLMEDVVRLVVDNEDITMTGMLGDTKNVKGKILRIDLTKQEALIQKID
ncbi:MAG: CooT family nickel-binding protein [ANME-2 cluster archaeon]|nr:CooT family nickel-binding protein [ANME-2 cluster archaeon]MCL7475051.1 CooT family nickel-binding protein [ANME-2 cluster archaeon]MDF1531887.1 CooT family nickel-binding protein [ANME-2 cluster archaeon]MDW7776268.1 CooT family nickel-binding protein [Methanosarcinales archaeon]